jgi:hypothetical protein
MLEHLNGTTFDWLSWQGGTLAKLGLFNRKQIILSNRQTIKRYAVGYCEGDQLLCRPKPNTIAVMFFKEGEFFWTHLMADEFWEIFKPEGEND